MPPGPPAAYPRRQRAWPCAHPHGQSEPPVPPASSPRLPQRLSSTTPRASPLITLGLSNADVARLTYLSPNTVKSYIHTIYRKIGVASRAQKSSGELTRLHTRRQPHRPLAPRTPTTGRWTWPSPRQSRSRRRPEWRCVWNHLLGRVEQPDHRWRWCVRGWQKTMTRPARDRDPRPHNRREIRPDAWRHTSKPWTSTCCRGATPTPERVASRPHPRCRSCHEYHPQSEGCGDTGDRALRDRPISGGADRWSPVRSALIRCRQRR